MSVESVSGNLPVLPEDDIGLGDFDTTRDAVIPRMQIKHQDAVFVDPLSKQTFTELTCIMLGLVKQRILWSPNVEDDEKPLCKSPDHNNGFPTVAGQPKLFPFSLSGYTPEQANAGAINGLPSVTCDGCLLKEWGSHPVDGKKPYCSEQYTFPIFYARDPNNPAGSLSPALFTTQKTGIKPANTYITGFANSRTAMYTAWTKITLKQFTRGQNAYCVPEYAMIGQTDPQDHPEYSSFYRSARTFVTSLPTLREDSPAVAGVAAQPVNPAVAAQAAPVQVAQPVATQPVATPVQAAQPVAAQPAPAPVQQAAQPAPVVNTSPAASVSALGDDDDLPF